MMTRLTPLTPLTRLLAATLIGLSAGVGIAADLPPTIAAPSDSLSTARARIEQKQWAAAIDELKRVNAPGSADWNNLMGYTHRKSKTPDLAAAERYYTEALRIDPKHLGALEYSGELALIKGDLPRAEQRLATLQQVCSANCEEFADLKAAVASYKAAGNKYVAKP